jgi:hypothetical protein
MTTSSTTAAALAQEHDAGTLAEALCARLAADGRAELAAAVASLLAPGEDAGLIDPVQPHPHRPASK